ncbi:hypothetical protein MMC10_002909 [Thelotrema lepadinum]|nr:hypothetical protein [Thelotrema lepadinum]
MATPLIYSEWLARPILVISLFIIVVLDVRFIIVLLVGFVLYRILSLSDQTKAEENAGRSHRRAEAESANEKHIAPRAEFTDAAVSDLDERGRSKSRIRDGRSGSQNRLETGLPIAAAGLGNAAIAGLWEKRKGNKADKERVEAGLAERHERRRSSSRSRVGTQTDSPRKPSLLDDRGGRSISIPFFVNLVRVDGWSFDSIRFMFEKRVRLQSREELVRVALDFFSFELREQTWPDHRPEIHQPELTLSQEPQWWPTAQDPYSSPRQLIRYGYPSLQQSSASFLPNTAPQYLPPLHPAKRTRSGEPNRRLKRPFNSFRPPLDTYTITRRGGPIPDVRWHFFPHIDDVEKHSKTFANSM